MARTVQVVLTEDLPSIGKSGELVKVRPGFARNFLIPRGLAAIATKDNVARIEHEKRMAASRAVKLRKNAEAIAERLAGITLTISCSVGEGDKLYGSVTSRDVEEALAEKGLEIDRRKIVMEPVKVLGVHDIPIKIASGVDASVKLEVVASQ